MHPAGLCGRALLPALLLGGVTAAPAAADMTDPPPALDLSAGVTLASDFRLRGLSLSNRRASIGATIDASHISGLHAQLRAASLSGPAARGADALVELAAGYRTMAGPVELDLGARYFAFAGSTGTTDVIEPYAALGYDIGPVSLSASAHYAPRQRTLAAGTTGRERRADNLYLRAGLDLGVPGTPLTLAAHIGRDTGSGQLTLARRYTEWGLGLRHSLGPLTLALDYADSNAGLQLANGRRPGGAGLIARATLDF
ncbi:hypothetical protein GVO57_01135 [Sphingomonas changnyeongensis]|uniref:Porin n=1 Tax=Sphingomonas changnyeongensis TaxID=2698679 RepID=A0A7Z2NUH4_9SPHN|nr:TorF family putative porin [Sphingomonas changnyeongensis]QHL89681.1 hypothetical protein GVO57_01135 [Sphingomonas changnyeongensis]